MKWVSTEANEENEELGSSLLPSLPSVNAPALSYFGTSRLTCGLKFSNKTVQATAIAPVSYDCVRSHNTEVAVVSAAAGGCA